MASVRTLFYDEVPPPVAVRVAPSSGLKPGDPVRVTVLGLLPGVSARVCAGEACAPVVAGTAELPAPRCGRGEVCSVTVASDAAFVQAVAVPLSYAAPPTADYSSTRLAAGLAVAGLLFGAALFLIRRGDWSAVGEEAAPEIDEAEYADLDAIVAALPPEPTLDELVAAAR